MANDLSGKPSGAAHARWNCIGQGDWGESKPGRNGGKRGEHSVGSLTPGLIGVTRQLLILEYTSELPEDFKPDI